MICREKLNRLIDKAMSEVRKFAEKVHPLFEANNWTYWNDGVPSVDSIAHSIVELLDSLRKGHATNEFGFGCANSGRVQVRVTNYHELRVVFELVPEDKSVYLDPCPECDGEERVENPEWNADKRQSSFIDCPTCS